MTTTNKQATEQINYLQALETAYLSGTDYTTELQTVAQIVAYSVIKKLINVSSNATMRKLRVELTGALHILQGTARLANKQVTTYNKDGKQQGHTSNDLDRLINQTIGDGIDIMQVATVELLDSLQTASKQGALYVGYLETMQAVKRPTKHIIIGDTVPTLKEVEQSPIQEVYRAVRRYTS